MDKNLIQAKKILLKILSVITTTFSLVCKTFSNYSKRFPRVFAGVLALVVIITIGATSLVMTGATIAYEVRYNGNVIGCVSEPDDITSAKALATTMVYDKNCADSIQSLQYSSVVTGSSKILEANELALAILNNSKDLKKFAVLLINDQVIAYQSTRTELNSIIREFLKATAQNSGADNAELLDTVTIKEAYYPLSLLSSIGTLSDLLNENPAAIPIKVILTQTQTESIPYKTIETNSNSYTLGTKKVTQQGQNGVANVIANVAYVNNVEVSREVITSTVVSQPVDELVTVGSKQAIKAASPKTTSVKASGSFVWPVERVSGSYVSAYYGDGRRHKGIDIAAKAGSKIYAARKGTVTTAGWDNSGFGKLVVIDHGNGLKTFYAHCSQINVKVGDVVGQGENIALVGRTGQATGNHLHFEVNIKGARVNPAPYIGA